MIELHKLTKKMGNTILFKNLSLSIEKGDYLAIIGPSGCGKTSLLNILGLIDDNYTGDYYLLNNHNVKSNTSKSQKIIRSTISYLFQNFALLEEESVKTNLLLALKYSGLSKKKKNEAIQTSLEKVDLLDKLTAKIYTLSSGEQQRVALARAILKPCQIILADEPTGSLDNANRDRVLDLLDHLHQEGKTIILVTHDSCVSQRANRVLDLKAC